MMQRSLTFCLLFVLTACQNPAEKKPEARGLDGRAFYPMKFSESAQARLDSNLAVARAAFDATPDSEEAAIWLGRRTAYLMRHHVAIDIYSRALEKHPRSYKLLRHRGHRYISTRQFDKAIVDFEKAAALIAGVPDEVEPDGAPNKYNIPTSTSHTNIYYHLGLAYYLNGRYNDALSAYENCLKFSKNNDMQVATLDWLYMTLRRLGRHDEALARIAHISPEMEILENTAYHRRLLLYQGALSVEEVFDDSTATALDLATYGYGIGNYHLANGDTAKARSIFKKVVAGEHWAAFGFIAAEVDLTRLSQ